MLYVYIINYKVKISRERNNLKFLTSVIVFYELFLTLGACARVMVVGLRYCRLSGDHWWPIICMVPCL